MTEIHQTEGIPAMSFDSKGEKPFLQYVDMRNIEQYLKTQFCSYPMLYFQKDGITTSKYFGDSWETNEVFEFVHERKEEYDTVSLSLADSSIWQTTISHVSYNIVEECSFDNAVWVLDRVGVIPVSKKLRQLVNCRDMCSKTHLPPKFCHTKELPKPFRSYLNSVENVKDWMRLISQDKCETLFGQDFFSIDLPVDQHKITNNFCTFLSWNPNHLQFDNLYFYKVLYRFFNDYHEENT